MVGNGSTKGRGADMKLLMHAMACLMSQVAAAVHK